MTRIKTTAALGYLTSLSRFCTNCGYSDGFVDAPPPTPEDQALMHAEGPYAL